VTTTAWMTHRDGGGLYRGGTVGRATRAWTVHAAGDATEVRTRAFFLWSCFSFLLLLLLLAMMVRIQMDERTNADDVQLLRYLPY
jgi:hypothetical protein